MERIKYRPPALKGMLLAPYGERRLRNREACAVIWDATGNVVHTTEGLLIEVNRGIIERLKENEELKALVLEHGYGCSGVSGIPPDILQYKSEGF